MAVSGWYPDPDGTPQRYRYWDGSRWSAQTTGNPADPPPYGPQPGPQPVPAGGRRRRSRAPVLFAVLAALVVVVLVVAFSVRSLIAGGGVLTDPNPPQPSVSGWNDSSPLPTATPPPTSSPDPTDSGAPRGRVACAAGDPSDHARHPQDGRIHGGRLSIEQPPSPWIRDDSYASGLSYAWDVAGASERVEPQWYAMVAVGEVHTADGFHTPKQSADGILQCIASSFYYEYFTGRKDLSSKRFSLDGHTGWAIRSEIRVDDPDVRASGDVVEVIVLDTGDRGKLSVFAGFVPIGDRARLDLLDRVIAGMRID